MFVAEGPEVVRTALDAGARPETVFVAPGATKAAIDLAARAGASGARVFELAPGVIERIADTVTPQPLLAVFAMHDVTTVPESPRLVVVMVDVRDPGNAGTVLRSADAAGVDAVVFAGGTVDPFNPKTVRASAGSLFHVPVLVRPDAPGALDELGACGLWRLGAVVRGGEDYATLDWTRPSALVVGNEASGLPATLPLDGTISIPMAGRAESLNVGMACAVVCFEALRRRRLGAGSQVQAHGDARSTMPR